MQADAIVAIAPPVLVRKGLARHVELQGEAGTGQRVGRQVGNRQRGRSAEVLDADRSAAADIEGDRRTEVLIVSNDLELGGVADVVRQVIGGVAGIEHVHAGHVIFVIVFVDVLDPRAIDQCAADIPSVLSGAGLTGDQEGRKVIDTTGRRGSG